MRELLENYDVLFFLTAITCVSLLMKIISSFMYRRLIRDSNQMGTTDNKWLKSMMAKFEAYYKLRISVHNVENFVDRYLYHYHFLGLSLQTWEYVGYYATAVTMAFSALFCLAAGYYQISAEWFLVVGFVVVALVLLQGMTELLLNTRQSRKIFRIQLIDYMENTMRARLENEYFNEKETNQYQMEYFEQKEEKETEEIQEEVQVAAVKEEKEVNAAIDGTQWKGKEMKELLASLLEELQLDKDIAKKQQALSCNAASERAQLFEEILKEYM